MKRLILVLLVCASACAAQETGSLRVTTTVHKDGSRTDVKTDPVARTSETSEYNAAGKLTQRVLYRLDDQNQPDAGIVYDAKGQIVYKMKLKRDFANRIVEETDYTPTDKFARRLVFGYDDKNRLIKVETYDQSGKLLSTSTAKARKGKPSAR